jgi:hypothetical protein
LLGPQRHVRTVQQTLRDLGVPPAGPVAIVTAGWEEREREVAEFEQHVECKVVNLELYHRVEELYARDPEYRDGLRERHDRMHQLQEVYRMRLSHAIDAALALFAREGDAALLEPEREHAIALVRALDDHHRQRLHELHLEHEARWRLAERESVAREREQLRRLIGECAALCIAGGHVAILLNRMRVLDLAAGIGTRPVVAWSAGAMAISEQVVLFHDFPPQGRGNAEVLEEGLGLARGILPLPHPRKRLDLDNPLRVGLFARRFAPAQCLALDHGARVAWDGARWRSLDATRRLVTDGTLAEVPA